MADDFILGKTECIHLIYPSTAGKIKTGKANVTGLDPNPGNEGGTYDVACTPGSSLPRHATSEPAAVSCPRCKASDPFKKLVELIDAVALGISDADKAALQQAISQQNN